MLKQLNIHHLNVWQIIITIIISSLIVLICGLTFILIGLSSYKNKQVQVLKNLQYIQNINIKERLQRIYQMGHINKQYNGILAIWIMRYQQLLTINIHQLIKDYQQITVLLTKHQVWKGYKLMMQVGKTSNDLKHQVELLTTEIDYVISIDQLLRHYQLFFKQTFNYLQDETIKINLQNSLNQAQLDEVINIINEMFKNLELKINDANLPVITNILNEITIAIITLAEILDNLPVLIYIVKHEINEKMKALQVKCQTINIDKSLWYQFEQLTITINDHLVIVNNQISNLQYKKAKIITKEILQKINDFNYKINKEQIFYHLFKQNYEYFLALNLNFNNIFASLKKQIDEIKQLGAVLSLEADIVALENTITNQLTTFNHFENLLIVENEKTNNNNTYEMMVRLLGELFTHTIIVFNNLKAYNKLVAQQNNPKIKFELYINKINSMMLQIDNILNNINYHYLNQSYETQFNTLQQLINDTLLNLKHNDDIEQSFVAFNNLQNKIFQLYTKLKMEIIIHKLSHLTLVYANRHRTINEQLKGKFDEIEYNLNHNLHQTALTLLLALMQ